MLCWDIFNTLRINPENWINSSHPFFLPPFPPDNDYFYCFYFSSSQEEDGVSPHGEDPIIANFAVGGSHHRLEYQKQHRGQSDFAKIHFGETNFGKIHFENCCLQTTQAKKHLGLHTPLGPWFILTRHSDQMSERSQVSTEAL